MIGYFLMLRFYMNPWASKQPTGSGMHTQINFKNSNNIRIKNLNSNVHIREVQTFDRPYTNQNQNNIQRSK